MSPSSKTVLITGFGLFGDYEVNSSWVAVKEVKRMGIGVEKVTLETREIAVEYDAIDKKIPQLVQKYKPILIVHVGVSGMAQTLTLEQCAHNSSYDKPDVKGKCPKHHCCKENGPSILKSSINMQVIAESNQVRETGITIATSQDAGRYCCDYIYYTSLALNEANVAFVHTPPLNRPFNAHTLGVGLRAIIQAMLEYIESRATT